MSRKRKCFDCGVDITHKNYVQRLDNGVIIKVCVNCAKKRTSPINRSYINRMLNGGV